MIKSKYEEYVEPRLIEIEGWCRDGLIDEEIAKRLGIGYSTLKNYKTEHQDFLDAIKNGKAIVDYSVEKALLTKALGGDTIACIFWLKNRKPKEWKDKQEYVHSGDVTCWIDLMKSHEEDDNGSDE